MEKYEENNAVDMFSDFQKIYFVIHHIIVIEILNVTILFVQTYVTDSFYV